MSNFLHHTQASIRPNMQCLSAQQYAYQSFCELLSGLIPFASKWHAGRILDKNVYINTSNSSLTTMYESILHNNTYMYFSLIDCSQETVVYVEGIIFV